MHEQKGEFKEGLIQEFTRKLDSNDFPERVFRKT
jgi:hypothetical protein